MSTIGAILYGAYIGVMIDAAALGFFNCDAYQNWKAEHEQVQEPAVICTFGDPNAFMLEDAPDAPDIVIVTD